MKIMTGDLVVSTVDNIIRFEDVSFTLDENDKTLIIFNDNDAVTVFPLCNVIYFNYYVKKGKGDNDV
jgi:hypothetical protein